MTLPTVIKPFTLVALTTLLVTGLFVTSLAFAQSDSTGSKQAESAPSTSETSPAKKRAPKTTSKPEQSEQVFKPSEEISEDLPVPFPIDI